MACEYIFEAIFNKKYSEDDSENKQIYETSISQIINIA